MVVADKSSQVVSPNYLYEVCFTMVIELYGSHWSQNTPLPFSLENLLEPICTPSEDLRAPCAHYECPSLKIWCGIIHKAPIWSMFYHWKWTVWITLSSKHPISIVTREPARAICTPSGQLGAPCGQYEVWDHPQVTYMKYFLPQEMKFRYHIGLKTLHSHCHYQTLLGPFAHHLRSA